MYKHIEAQIILTGTSKRELAEKMGISYNTLITKLNGKSAFTLDEAIKVKNAIKANEPLEVLFQKSA